MSPTNLDYESPDHYKKDGIYQKLRMFFLCLRQILTNPSLGYVMTEAVAKNSSFDQLNKLISTNKMGRLALNVLTAEMLHQAVENKSRGRLYILLNIVRKFSTKKVHQVYEAILNVSPIFEDAFTIFTSTTGQLKERARQIAFDTARTYGSLRLLWGEIVKDPALIKQYLNMFLDAAQQADEETTFEFYQSLLDDASGDPEATQRILTKLAFKAKNEGDCMFIMSHPEALPETKLEVGRKYTTLLQRPNITALPDSPRKVFPSLPASGAVGDVHEQIRQG